MRHGGASLCAMSPGTRRLLLSSGGIEPHCCRLANSRRLARKGEGAAMKKR
jgi:hypothetical protein